MAKYKIHTDRPKISKEEAEEKMDFDFVLKQLYPYDNWINHILYLHDYLFL